MLATRLALAHPYRPRDVIAYRSGCAKYWHPIGLRGRISKAKADEIAARGNAYLIGEFGEKRQLARVAKICSARFSLDTTTATITTAD